MESSITRGRGTGLTEESIEHRRNARSGNAPTRAQLQQEAREHQVPYYYRMKVGKLEELRAKGWNVTDDDIAEFITT